MNWRPLEIAQILRWADAYREATGHWPTQTSGAIAGTIGETWQAINVALVQGCRSLPGGSSLAQLLAEHRGKRNKKNLPKLAEDEILAWADEYRTATGRWPTLGSGAIPGKGGETWKAVDYSLRRGSRALPGGTSLARLLAEQRGVAPNNNLPPLSEEQILAWADARYRQCGSWPEEKSGTVFDAPSETWAAINRALRRGFRNLPAGSSLPRLLAKHRGVRNRKAAPKLSEEQILRWADAYHESTGAWPKRTSGAIAATEESWHAVDAALCQGIRGLPGKGSLAKLLAARRGVPSIAYRNHFTRKDILAWADAYRKRTGAWPTREAGPIQESPGETWESVDHALRVGRDGLRGGASLAMLLARYRRRRSHLHLPPLSYKKILRWAEAHRRETGAWPTCNSGPVRGAHGENWKVIDSALRSGARHLPGGCSLAELLARKRGRRNPQKLPPLQVEQILAWADAHHARTGQWPKINSGPIEDAPGETWLAVESALRNGCRGFLPGSSLARLLAEYRDVPNGANRPPLTVEQILMWARAHHERTGQWPTKTAGAIPEAVGETWSAVDSALSHGARSLPRGLSLARLRERPAEAAPPPPPRAPRPLENARPRPRPLSPQTHPDQAGFEEQSSTRTMRAGIS